MVSQERSEEDMFDAFCPPIEESWDTRDKPERRPLLDDADVVVSRGAAIPEAIRLAKAQTKPAASDPNFILVLLTVPVQIDVLLLDT